MKKWVGGSLIVLSMGVALLYWGARELVYEVIGHQPVTASDKPAEPAKKAGVLVDVALAKEQRLAQQVTAVGSLLAQNATTIRAESSGRIAQILFEEGKAVTAGALLLQLDTDLLKAELQQAQAQLNLANSRAHRAQQLRQQGFISRQAQDEASSERAVAQAQVNIIKTKIDKSEIRAPFDGVLGLRHVSVGDYVSQGAEIVSLASLDKLQVDFRVPERYLNQLQVGSPIHLQLDSQPDQTFQGQVNAISPIVDEQGRAVQLRAHVSNPEGQLRPGLFARVVLDLAQLDAVMVPETALAPAGQSQYVYRVTEGDVAQRVEVQVGIRRDGWVQVSGVQAGDQVLTTGLQKIKEGTALQIRSDTQSPTPTAQEG